MSAFGT